MTTSIPSPNGFLKKKRLPLLQPSVKDTNNDRAIIVTTHHPQMPKVHSVPTKHANVLSDSDRMSKVLPNRPLLALRRPPNLGNRLIKTRPRPSQSDQPSLPEGTHKCGNARCQICPKHLVTGSSVISKSTSITYYTKGHINCNSKRVIYLISCSVCGLQYVGQTVTKLRERFNGHKSGIGCHDMSKVLTRHYTSSGHNGVADMRLQGLEAVSETANIDEVESKQIWNLKTNSHRGGLNIDEHFLHKVTITN